MQNLRFSGLLIALLIQGYDPPPKRKLTKEEAALLKELAGARDEEEERRFAELDARRASKDESIPSEDA
jgi:hypothetical protein